MRTVGVFSAKVFSLSLSLTFMSFALQASIGPFAQAQRIQRLANAEIDQALTEASHRINSMKSLDDLLNAMPASIRSQFSDKLVEALPCQLQGVARKAAACIQNIPISKVLPTVQYADGKLSAGKLPAIQIGALDGKAVLAVEGTQTIVDIQETSGKLKNPVEAVSHFKGIWDSLRGKERASSSLLEKLSLQSAHAFTVIELIVVIAIIVIAVLVLAAIVLGAVALICYITGKKIGEFFSDDEEDDQGNAPAPGTSPAGGKKAPSGGN